jgi:rhodanese-related sulfurtransferase
LSAAWEGFGLSGKGPHLELNSVQYNQTMTQTFATITVKQLEQVISDAHSEFIILDVRQPWELQLASLPDSRVLHLPMHALAEAAHRQLPKANPSHPPIYVVCHHGQRSATVARWLVQQGWVNSYNVAGGLDRYQAEIDGSIGQY